MLSLAHARSGQLQVVEPPPRLISEASRTSGQSDFPGSAATPDTIWGSCAPESLDGQWVHQDRPGICEVIRGDTLYGPDGTVKKLTFPGDDRVSLVLHGRAFEAQLLAGRLVWDDGDVWLRPPPIQEGYAFAGADSWQPLPRPFAGRNLPLLAFSGHWKHQRSPEFVETIQGDSLIGPSGSLHRVTFCGGNRISINVGGKSCSAALVGNELFWDDGDVWLRVAAAVELDGRWVHQGKPGVVEIVKGGTLFAMDGAVKTIMAMGNGTFFMVLHGNAFQARLVGDKLLWNDGDTWLREGRQEHCTVA